jgi:hypothetical protein
LTYLRRALAGRRPAESMALMLKLLDRFPTNEALLNNIRVEES